MYCRNGIIPFYVYVYECPNLCMTNKSVAMCDDDDDDDDDDDKSKRDKKVSIAWKSTPPSVRGS